MQATTAQPTQPEPTVYYVLVHREAPTRREFVGVALNDAAGAQLAVWHAGRPLTFETHRSPLYMGGWYALSLTAGPSRAGTATWLLTTSTRTVPLAFLGLHTDPGSAMRAAATHAGSVDTPKALIFRRENGQFTCQYGKRAYRVRPGPTVPIFSQVFPLQEAGPQPTGYPAPV